MLVPNKPLQMEKTELPPDMILSGNKWLRSKNGKGLFRMLRGLWVPGPPEASLSPGSSFNEGEEMTPASCYSQGFLFCFKLQSLLRQSIILLSGEQTQQLKGRARQVLRAEVPGTASTASCPKGTPNPLQASCTLSQNPHSPTPPAHKCCSEPGGREVVVVTAKACCSCFFYLCPESSTPCGNRRA